MSMTTRYDYTPTDFDTDDPEAARASRLSLRDYYVVALSDDSRRVEAFGPCADRSHADLMKGQYKLGGWRTVALCRAVTKDEAHATATREWTKRGKLAA